MKNSKKRIHFQVAVNGNSWLSNDGLIEYTERYNMAVRGEISFNEVYGYDQCIQHIAQYYGKQDEYTEKRQKDVLTIEKVTTITETLEYNPIPPIPNAKRIIKTIAETD